MLRPLASPCPRRYVCEFTNILRARLLFGLYHRLSRPKWQQYIAKLYCLLVAVLYITVYHVLHNVLSEFLDFWSWYGRTRCLQYTINIIASLWTEEAFVFTFCTLAKFTDITLDSAAIFFKFEKTYQLRIITLFIFKITTLLLYIIIFYSDFSITAFILNVYTQTYLLLNFMNQCLVLGVLRSRLQVLRARLARHGFRRARDCALGINVYCDMYTETLESFKNIENYLKVLVTVNYIADTVCCICITCSVISISTLTEDFMKYACLIFVALDIMAQLYFICYEMEMAAEQVEAIREIAVTELLKNPSARERRAILELLAVTAAAPARLPLCRAVQVDARLLLAAIGFSTGRVVLILQTTQK